MGSSLIVGLFLRGCPSDIAAFVVAVNIDAIHTVFRCRPFANLRNKFLKRYEEKLYTAASVAGIIMTAGVSAALFSIMESAVFWRHFAMLSVSVNNMVLGSEALTALDSPIFDICSSRHDFISARAAAAPSGIMMDIHSAKFNNVESSEDLASKINKTMTVFLGRIRFSHVSPTSNRILRGQSRRETEDFKPGRSILTQCYVHPMYML